MEIQQTGKLHLIWIAIDRYKQNCWPTLSNAVSGSEALEATLQDGFGLSSTQTLSLENRNATLAEIEKCIRSYGPGGGNELSEGDQLLISFAGHGERDKLTGETAFIPFEGDPDSTSTWLRFDHLRPLLRVINARHILVISDSCFSGGVFRDGPAEKATNVDFDYAQRALAKNSRCLISSGGVERVFDAGGKLGCSVFIEGLLHGLRFSNKKWILAEEVFATLRSYVVANSTQTPEYGPLYQSGHGGGQFIFEKHAGDKSRGRVKCKKVVSHGTNIEKISENHSEVFEKKSNSKRTISRKFLVSIFVLLISLYPIYVYVQETYFSTSNVILEEVSTPRALEDKSATHEIVITPSIEEVKTWRREYQTLGFTHTRRTATGSPYGGLIIGLSGRKSHNIWDFWNYISEVLSLDAEGNEIWRAKFGDDENGFSLHTLLPQGDGVVAVGNLAIDPKLGAGIALLKINTVGDPVWRRDFNILERMVSWGANLAGENIVIVGSGEHTQNRRGNRGYILYLDGNGDEIWRKISETSEFGDKYLSVSGNHDGSIYVARKNCKTDFLNCSLEIENFSNSGFMNWVAPVNFVSPRLGEVFLVNSEDGSVFVVGSRYGNGDMKRQIGIVLLSGDGRVVWEVTIGGDGSTDTVHSATLARNGDLLIGGDALSSSLGGAPGKFLVRLDTSGDVIGMHTYPPRSSAVNEIIPRDSQGYFLIGRSAGAGTEVIAVDEFGGF